MTLLVASNTEATIEARRVLFARSRFLCASVPLWPSPFVAAARPRSGRSPADSPLQESAPVRYAITWRDGQTHVDVVRLSVTFDRFSSLLEHLSKDSRYAPKQVSIQHLPLILRYDHNVVLAFPSHMRQAFSFRHAGSNFGGPTGSSRRGNLAQHAAALEAFWVTPPVAACL